jgi:hypothetical protein
MDECAKDILLLFLQNVDIRTCLTFTEVCKKHESLRELRAFWVMIGCKFWNTLDECDLKVMQTCEQYKNVVMSQYAVYLNGTHISFHKVWPERIISRAVEIGIFRHDAEPYQYMILTRGSIRSEYCEHKVPTEQNIYMEYMTEKIGQEVGSFAGYGCCKEIRDTLQELKWKYTIQGFQLGSQHENLVVYLYINVSDVNNSNIRYIVKQSEDLPAYGKKFSSLNRRTNKVTAEKIWKGGDIRINVTQKPSFCSNLQLHYPSEDVLLYIPIPSKTPSSAYGQVGSTINK